ncbi:MAG: ATP-binding protein [Elusimicrobia bacterium]|nr:ATP-binding protein [Elusimicrobiota bacterium]
MYSRLLSIPPQHSFFLFGPRLTGKSTLLRQSFPANETFTVDLLETGTLQRYLAEPRTLERELAASPRKRVVIDEVQRAPALLDEVHRLMESSGREVQFVMSGSSARKLKRARANLLGGRAWTLQLHPLSWRELGPDFDLVRALSFGTLPKAYSSPDEEAREDLRAYVEAYVAEEVQAEALARNLGAFLRFLPLAGGESGRILNATALGREIGVNYKTIQEYFRILEDTLLGFLLDPYAKSARRRLTRHPKFYFFDTGVLRAITKSLAVPVEPRSPQFGVLFEHHFINEVRRLNSYGRLDLALSFYRTDAGAEVDLVIARAGRPPLAVEIKATERPAPAHCSGLLSFAELEPHAELAIACLVERPQQFRFGAKTVSVLPWRECLERIQS